MLLMYDEFINEMKTYKGKKFLTMLDKSGIGRDNVYLDIDDGSAYVLSNNSDIHFYDSYLFAANSFSNFSDIEWLFSIIEKLLNDGLSYENKLTLDYEYLENLLKKSKDSDFSSNGAIKYYLDLLSKNKK